MRRSARSSICCPRWRGSASTMRSSISRRAEVPIMDGSAAPFVFLLQSAGIEEQNAPKRFVRVLQARRGRAKATSGCGFDPYDGFSVNVEIDFDHPALRKHRQAVSIDFSTTSFLKEISRARTFGFLQDLETSRASEPCARRQPRQRYRDGRLPRAQRGRPALPRRVRAAQGARRARRSVSARPGLIGEFTGFKCGHGLNNLLLRALLEQPGLLRGSRVRRRRSSARRFPTSSRTGH